MLDIPRVCLVEVFYGARIVESIVRGKGLVGQGSFSVW